MLCLYTVFTFLFRWKWMSRRNGVWLCLLLQHTRQLQVCVSLWLWLWAEHWWLPRCERMLHRHQPLYLRVLQYRWRLLVWLSWRFLQSWTGVREHVVEIKFCSWYVVLHLDTKKHCSVGWKYWIWHEFSILMFTTLTSLTLCFSAQSLYNRLRFPKPVSRGWGGWQSFSWGLLRV